MTLRQRALYHQIHPAKLAVDWTAGLAGAILLWQHRLAAGLFWGLGPPIVASAPFLLGFCDRTLTRYQASALGGYIARSMTRGMEALRLVGLAVLWYGAWRHQLGVFALGLVLIVLAWLRGWVWPPRRSIPHEKAL
jgi:hypothetical protein